MRKLRPVNHKKAVKKVVKKAEPILPSKVGKPYDIYKDGKLVVDAKGLAKQKKFSYVEVEYDFDGWADASRFMPNDYDLCCCKLEKGTKMGWAHGLDWEGYKIKPEDRILYWKKMKGES